MITARVDTDAIFVSDNNFILSYENELKIIKYATTLNQIRLIFKLPDSWKTLKKVVCVKWGAKTEYIALNDNKCYLPDKFNGCVGVSLQLITEDENGNLFNTNEVIIN